MASTTLYPPIVKDYEPAFVAGANAKLKVYFNLSSLSGALPSGFFIHASVIKKDGTQVVNLQNDTTRDIYRATGTILNLEPISDGNNTYHVEILNSDLKSEKDYYGTWYQGWLPGWNYKVQLRISEIKCPASAINNQEAWMQENSAYFSEWSTICYVKCISPMIVKSNFSEDLSFRNSDQKVFSGSIESLLQEANEDYYKCNLSLYKYLGVGENPQLLEQSGDIFNNGISHSAVYYIFKTDFEQNSRYLIYFNYITENDYKPDTSLVYSFTYNENSENACKVKITTIETNIDGMLDDVTSLGQEEDEGRIGLKIYYDNEVEGNNYSQFLIRRASSKDNFAIWEDIVYLSPGNDAAAINAYPIVYDYTIESGVWYKYGIAGVTNEGVRTSLNKITNPIIRIFEYSYLLGFGGKQLKLQFDNTISSYSTKVLDGMAEPVGSKYPYLNRNGSTYYQTFPITGLISFWMDENNTFLQNGLKDIYLNDDIVALYQQYNANRNIHQYDYTYEREFRKKVMEFLQDGQVKLFKSPTEGNIIIRLKDITFTPNQSLDRMIYSFNATAVEIDDNTMKNYLKYGFYYPGTYSTGS